MVKKKLKSMFLLVFCAYHRVIRSIHLKIISVLGWGKGRVFEPQVTPTKKIK